MVPGASTKHVEKGMLTNDRPERTRTAEGAKRHATNEPGNGSGTRRVEDSSGRTVAADSGSRQGGRSTGVSEPGSVERTRRDKFDRWADRYASDAVAVPVDPPTVAGSGRRARDDTGAAPAIDARRLPRVEPGAVTFPDDGRPYYVGFDPGSDAGDATAYAFLAARTSRHYDAGYAAGSGTGYARGYARGFGFGAIAGAAVTVIAAIGALVFLAARYGTG